jgi:hypothetical protein
LRTYDFLSALGVFVTSENASGREASISRMPVSAIAVDSVPVLP